MLLKKEIKNNDYELIGLLKSAFPGGLGIKTRNMDILPMFLVFISEPFNPNKLF